MPHHQTQWFNYGHPGPWRVWKVGSEQHLLTPLPWPPRPPRPPAANSKTLPNTIDILFDLGTFAPPKMNFKQSEHVFWDQNLSKHIQKCFFDLRPQGYPRRLQDPSRDPKGLKRRPRDPFSRSKAHKLFRYFSAPRTKHHISRSQTTK